MKIGILQCGRLPEAVAAKHGEYDALYAQLLADRGFEFVTYPVLDNLLPEHPHDADGWLISGSKFGAYDELPWIPPFEDFLRKAYAARVPIVGICFGHQILAQALGGTVEAFSGGWSAGGETYELEGLDGPTRLMAWHQDQVIAKPVAARAVGSSPFCRYAALVYGDRAYTLQPHPEFSDAFVRDLVSARRDVLPPAVVRMAERSLGAETRSNEIATLIETFFRKPREDGAAEPRASDQHV